MEGGDAELAVEDANAFAVLAEGESALARPGVELHECAVSRFVEGVEGEPALGVGDGVLEVSLANIAGYELLQGFAEVTAEVFRLLELPVVELRAIAEGEAGEEVALVEPDGGAKGSYAVRAGIGGGMSVGAAGVQMMSKNGDVTPEGLVWLEGNSLALCVEPSSGEGFVEWGECAAERGTGVGGVSVRPEKGGEGVPAVGLPCNDEVGDERGGFARVDVDGDTVEFNAGWSEEEEVKLGH